jgi:hypothetical protein
MTEEQKKAIAEGQELIANTLKDADGCKKFRAFFKNAQKVEDAIIYTLQQSPGGLTQDQIEVFILVRNHLMHTGVWTC